MDLLAQATTVTYEVETSASGLAAASFMLVWSLIILLVIFIALWKVFTKAGEPGWKALIPIYNTYIMVKIAGRPGWWFLLFFIPIVSFVVYIIISIDIAKAFGKSATFGVVGLWLFSFIGFMILGWGDSTYTKPDNS